MTEKEYREMIETNRCHGKMIVAFITDNLAMRVGIVGYSFNHLNMVREFNESGTIRA